jgi:60 kDa SS-A/Ro ribonucleoprotein
LNQVFDPANQREKADPAQVMNNAGGFVFAINDWDRLERFLILGSEGGTYYVGERTLTRENAQVVEKLIKTDGKRVVDTIVKISDGNRAPKNDPAILALAMAARLGDAETKTYAFAALPKVCRTGTHLYHFVAFADKLGGWGRGMRRAVASWFTSKTADQLAHQLIKYQQRDGWSARDLLRLSHAKPTTGEHDVLFAWATGGRDAAQEKLVVGDKKRRFELNPLPPMIEAFEELKTITDIKRAVELISKYKLPREAVPTQLLTKRDVWDALLPHMGATAMMRNIATMTRVGLIEPMGERTAYIAAKLGDVEFLKKGRVHPIQALAALKVYAQGHGERGTNTWSPNQSIIDALDAAFYATFDNVEPTGKSTVLALDVSGSMTWASSLIAGMPGMTARIASVAMAMVTLHVEKRAHVIGFTTGTSRSMHSGIGSGLCDIPISPRMRLDDAIKAVERIPAGGTDCALPMLWAKTQRSAVESFGIYTDNETWAGNVHPHVALKDYRQAKGVAARLAVVGMTSTGFTIADPNDAGMLDLVGFDSAAPAIMNDFFRGAGTNHTADA